MHVTENVSGEEHTYQLNVDSGTDDIWRLYFVLSNTSDAAIPVPKVTVLDAPSGSLTGSAIQTTRNSVNASLQDALRITVYICRKLHTHTFPMCLLFLIFDLQHHEIWGACVVHLHAAQRALAQQKVFFFRPRVRTIIILMQPCAT